MALAFICHRPIQEHLVCLQVLKGGHQAPTKPKGRPKKNSIPTTEEIEAEERRLAQLAEEEERLRGEVQAEVQEQFKTQGEVFESQPQDLSTSRSEILHSLNLEASDGEQLPQLTPQS